MILQNAKSISRQKQRWAILNCPPWLKIRNGVAVQIVMYVHLKLLSHISVSLHTLISSFQIPHPPPWSHRDNRLLSNEQQAADIFDVSVKPNSAIIAAVHGTLQKDDVLGTRMPMDRGVDYMIMKMFRRLLREGKEREEKGGIEEEKELMRGIVRMCMVGGDIGGRGSWREILGDGERSYELKSLYVWLVFFC